jgi:hypothetical protein
MEHRRRIVSYRRTVTECRQTENKLNCHCRKLHERIDILEERALDHSVEEIFQEISGTDQYDNTIVLIFVIVLR